MSYSVSSIEHLIDLLNDILDLLSLPIIVSKVVPIQAVCLLHSLERFLLISTLELDERVGEETLRSGIVIFAKLATKPAKYIVVMLLSLIIINWLDFLHLVVHHMQQQVVVNYEFAPDLNDLHKERLRIPILAHLEEQLSQVEVGAAEVD